MICQVALGQDPAAAPRVPLDPTVQPVEWIAAFATALREGHWQVALALGLVFVVGAVKKFRVGQDGGTKVPAWLQKWLPSMLAGAVTVSTGVLAGQTLLQAASQGLLVGWAAVGAHQTTVKPGMERYKTWRANGSGGTA